MSECEPRVYRFKGRVSNNRLRWESTTRMPNDSRVVEFTCDADWFYGQMVNPEPEPDWSAPKVGTFLGPKIPGVNVDKIDREAGIRMLMQIGYDPKVDWQTFMVIDHCLWRWGHGEEDRAEKQAIDKKEFGISFTEWRMCLAAAMAGGEDKEKVNG
jgi:hypothetical protein